MRLGHHGRLPDFEADLKESFRHNSFTPEGGKEDAVKRTRFSVEQIVAVLKQAEMGAPIADLIRHLGIAEQTFYRWKQRYAGLESDQVRQFKQLQDENTQLKRLVVELSLDKVMLQDVLAKKF
jgi:putative transposase